MAKTATKTAPDPVARPELGAEFAHRLRDPFEAPYMGVLRANDPLLLERGINFDDPEPETAEVPKVDGIAGGPSTIEIAARAKLAEVKAKTEQLASGKVKMVTVDELRARRKAAKLEMTP